MKKDTIIYGIAIVFERAISFFTLPILTKELPVELYGVWSQIIVTMGLLIPIVLLGFQTAIVNFFAGNEADSNEKRNIFIVMSCIVIINLFAIVACTNLFSPLISRFIFGDPVFAGYVPIFGYLLSTEALFELLVGYLRSGQKIKLLAVYYVIKSILRIGVLALGLMIFDLSLYAVLTSLILLHIIFIVVIYVKDVLARSNLDFNMAYWRSRSRELLIFGLPLVPLSILSWGNNFVDRYLILNFLNIKQVAIYAVAYSIAAIVALFYSILGFTLYPKIAQLWNEGQKIQVAALLQKGVGYYLFFLIPSIATLTIMNKSIIDIFSTTEYSSSYMVIFFLSAGIGLFGLYQIYFYVTLLASRTVLNLLVMTVSVLANVMFNYVLIPRVGIIGAALATALSNGILALWTMELGKKAIPIVFPWSDAGRIVLATGVMSLFLLVARHSIAVYSVWTLATVGAAAGVLYLTMDVVHKNSIVRRLKANI